MFGGRRRHANEYTAMQELLSRNTPMKKAVLPIQERPKAEPQARKPLMNVFEARRIGLRMLDGTGLGYREKLLLKDRILSAASLEEVDRIAAEMRELEKAKRKK